MCAEQAADCLRDLIRAAGDSSREESLRKVSDWSGISVNRLTEILDGMTSYVTAGEFIVCRALGESTSEGDRALAGSRAQRRD